MTDQDGQPGQAGTQGATEAVSRWQPNTAINASAPAWLREPAAWRRGRTPAGRGGVDRRDRGGQVAEGVLGRVGDGSRG
ncbi:hypothetical protein [Streptomyces alfalfae]|uniref:Uncharacterized protein n=1 Tax=Streptomyces alfalfae TaxID=1642299 RepID=A0A7T4PNI1_9ACTN|nr:hypothetical protein [Streptomyces alfalfae]QQC93384.1 hypothetical protein I8755_37455 [Streptomyces alfalfae]